MHATQTRTVGTPVCDRGRERDSFFFFFFSLLFLLQEQPDGVLLAVTGTF
jgi:hypothetical protein